MFPHDYNDALIWMFFYSLEALALILNQSYPQVDVFALSDGLGIYTLLQNPPALVVQQWQRPLIKDKVIDKVCTEKNIYLGIILIENQRYCFNRIKEHSNEAIIITMRDQKSENKRHFWDHIQGFYWYFYWTLLSSLKGFVVLLLLLGSHAH